MKTTVSRLVCVMAAAIIVFASLASAAEMETIKLPAPETEGGKPLMQALNDRHSTRAFDPRNLPEQMMSNLLWAAWGINRSDSGKRTAPSPNNKQEVDLYVFTADGVFLYEAKEHQLIQTSEEDLRGATTSKQEFVKTAPVTLLYVRDPERGVDTEHGVIYSAVSVGAILQNVYLFCASEGLATVSRVSFDGPALIAALGLPADQRAIMASTVGYPVTK